jgi:hypothetical protein
MQPLAGRGQQQHGRHQAAGEVLLRPGRERHPPRDPAAPGAGDGLRDHAGDQLRPGQPDDADDDLEDEPDRHLTVEAARRLRDRVADGQHQRDRHAADDHDHEQCSEQPA